MNAQFSVAGAGGRRDARSSAPHGHVPVATPRTAHTAALCARRLPGCPSIPSQTRAHTRLAQMHASAPQGPKAAGSRHLQGSGSARKPGAGPWCTRCEVRSTLETLCRGLLQLLCMSVSLRMCPQAESCVCALPLAHVGCSRGFAFAALYIVHPLPSAPHRRSRRNGRYTPQRRTRARGETTQATRLLLLTFGRGLGLGLGFCGGCLGNLRFGLEEA